MKKLQLDHLSISIRLIRSVNVAKTQLAIIGFLHELTDILLDQSPGRKGYRVECVCESL